MEQYGVHSLKEYLSLMTSTSIPGLSTFINVVIGIAMVIGFIVIFQAMYAAVMERTREIGILKSLGAGKLYIVNVILRETLLISVGGIILGIVVSYAARSALHAKFQTLPILITPDWLVRATIIAIIGSMLGAVVSGAEGRPEGPHRRAGVRIAWVCRSFLRSSADSRVTFPQGTNEPHSTKINKLYGEIRGDIKILDLCLSPFNQQFRDQLEWGDVLEKCADMDRRIREIDRMEHVRL